MDDILEQIKVESALRSENMKLEYRAIHKPNEISVLDYTIIAALEKQISKEVKTQIIDREEDIEYLMLCPCCEAVVGDVEWNELHFDYCPTCGQKLKYSGE